MTARPDRLATEFAHILMMDVVGFSRQSINQQAAQIVELRRLVEAATEYRTATAQGELICLDRGDGIALVFFRDPVAPLQCAIEIARALRSAPEFALRMGVHSGTITRRSDINARPNVYGDGINMAQRVMDCGDADHILLSRASADALLRLDEWAAHLHDCGEFAVKHGQRIHLYNYHDGEVGNPTPPQSALSPAPARSDDQPAPAALLNPRVVLLYKRSTQPDERLLKLLETQLKARGYSVFVDRHLTIGVEWAREIERQVSEADAVIPLLSEAAIHSEMLEYEVQMAHRAAQKQGNRPRLLPVRIGFTGPLPDPLAVVLGPLQYTLWQTPQDDARLVAEIVHALQTPPPLPSEETLDAVGGAVPLESRFYITRPADREFKTAIARRDSIVLVKGARQMGKTSLLARGMQQAREAGAKVVFTDFQTITDASLETPDAFYFALCRALKMQLELEVSIRDSWDEDLDASGNMEWFLRRQVLARVSEPVVWALDEVDRLFSCGFGGQVFGLFRSWHNRRAVDPAGPWSRLTLALAYATEAHLFITDLNQSPFNVGTRLTLEDFTPEQVAELNRRYGEPLRNQDEQERLYRLVGGQPYLVRRSLDTLVTQRLNVAALEAQADRDEGLFGDHLRRMLVLLAKDAELLEAVRSVLRGAPTLSAESFYRLRSAGVMVGDSAREVRPRCLLYASYLQRHLLPDAN